MTIRRDIQTLKEAGTLTLRVWRQALPFFLSIELWLMVLLAGATVGGLFLAVLHDMRSLLAFGFVVAYVGLRSVLHVKRILSWPFI